MYFECVFIHSDAFSSGWHLSMLTCTAFSAYIYRKREAVACSIVTCLNNSLHSHFVTAGDSIAPAPNLSVTFVPCENKVVPHYASPFWCKQLKVKSQGTVLLWFRNVLNFIRTWGMKTNTHNFRFLCGSVSVSAKVIESFQENLCSFSFLRDYLCSGKLVSGNRFHYSARLSFFLLIKVKNNSHPYSYCVYCFFFLNRLWIGTGTQINWTTLIFKILWFVLDHIMGTKQHITYRRCNK